MPTIRTQDMHGTATYWAPTGANTTGQATFAAPVTAVCRWQRKSILFRDAQGRETMSNAIVYIGADIAIRGWLFEGTSVAADPKTVAGAKEIRQVDASPDLSEAEILIKAIL